MMRLAVDGLISFSGAPLRLVTYLGLATALAATGLTGWAVWDAVWHRSAPRGWASLLVVVLFMGAAQMLSLGIVGEYVRRIFLEVKRRPTYVLSERPSGRRPMRADRPSSPTRRTVHRDRAAQRRSA